MFIVMNKMILILNSFHIIELEENWHKKVNNLILRGIEFWCHTKPLDSNNFALVAYCRPVIKDKDEYKNCQIRLLHSNLKFNLYIELNFLSFRVAKLCHKKYVKAHFVKFFSEKGVFWFNLNTLVLNLMWQWLNVCKFFNEGSKLLSREAANEVLFQVVNVYKPLKSIYFFLLTRLMKHWRF